MNDVRPSAQTTLGILLGASKWPNAKLQGSPAFANSAQKVKEYFLSPNRFGIRSENWLDLFDQNQSSPYEVDQAISTFLQERILLMKEADTPATDVLFYYIGHGILVFGSHQAFHLAIHSTDDERVRSSAISMAALADTLKAKARHLRRFVILDCCFAAESSRYMMQSEIGQAAVKQTIADFEEKSTGSGFPKKGTTLLCSSGFKDTSLLLPDESGTMFSEALIRALALGNIRYPKKTHLSLHDLRVLIEEVLEDITAGNAPRPEVHSPDQSEGDVASIPFFPNSRVKSEQKLQVEGSKPASKENVRFDRFTERALKVLNLAQAEAVRFEQNYIGTEHLLLGLLSEGGGIAIEVLSSLDIELDQVRGAVEFIIGRGDRIILGEIGLTPGAKMVIELSVDEARRLNHHYLDTEHLLLGLVREGKGIAAGVLESLGANLEKVRAQVVQVISPDYVNQVKQRYLRTPITNQLCEDLTAEARTGKSDPVISRRKEIDFIIQILNRFKNNSLVLIGEPGTEKTAFVEELARRLVNGQVPRRLGGRRLLRLNLTPLLASAKSPGERERFLKRSIDEITSNDCILFIENMSQLIGADAIPGIGMGNVAQLLKSAFSRGDFQCLGTCTPEAYATLFKQERTLLRWFEEVIVSQPALEEPLASSAEAYAALLKQKRPLLAQSEEVGVPRPTLEETLKILHDLRNECEIHHNLIITDEALKAAAEVANRYVTGSFIPDRIMNLIDDAATLMQMQNPDPLPPPNLRVTLKALECVLHEKEQAIQQQEYELAAEFRDREVRLRDRIAKLESGWHRGRRPSVGEKEVAQVVAMRTGIPVMQIFRGQMEGFIMKQIVEGRLEEALRDHVIGQNEAIEKVAHVVRRTYTSKREPKHPIASFIFVGSMGVGKKTLAKALAEVLFDGEENLITLSMGEFTDPHAMDRLTGSRDSIHLTEFIRYRPYNVLLFDEIEKAHPNVVHMLFQILKNGKLTDASGRMVDFTNTIIVMTSNVGLSLLNGEASISFQQSKEKAKANQEEDNAMKEKMLEELKKTFGSESLNCIDEVIVFHTLDMKEAYSIIDLLLKPVRTQLLEPQVELVVPLYAKDFLIEKGFDAQNGARPLRRTIQLMIEDQLAEGLLQGKFVAGDLVEAVVIGGELVLQVRNRIEQLPAPPQPD